MTCFSSVGFLLLLSFCFIFIFWEYGIWRILPEYKHKLFFFFPSPLSTLAIGLILLDSLAQKKKKRVEYVCVYSTVYVETQRVFCV